MASSRSNLSSRPSSGKAPSRTSAAASPPRIWGPLVRTMRPYKPAFAAALSSSVPAVITPLPPLPASAIDTLAPADRGAVLLLESACTSRLLGECLRAGWYARGSSVYRWLRWIGSGSAQAAVKRLYACLQLTQIKARRRSLRQDRFHQTGIVVP
jgi:hypothetical protein